MQKEPEPAPTYDADYFINKFSAIPEDRWCVGQFTDRNGRCCVMGHLGMRAQLDKAWQEDFSPEVQSLCSLLGPYQTVVNISNGETFMTGAKAGDGETPRQRVLKALQDVKAGTYRMPL